MEKQTLSKALLEKLNQSYQELHRAPFVLLGDHHHFFYFTASNFELYRLLRISGIENHIRDNKMASEVELGDI